MGVDNDDVNTDDTGTDDNDNVGGDNDNSNGNEAEPLLADWICAPRRSGRLAGRDPRCNFNLPMIDIDAPSVSNDDLFFAAEFTYDDDFCNSINLALFTEQHKGGVCIFQSMIHDKGTGVDPAVHDILSSKHSLESTAEGFFNDGDPSALQHHLTGASLKKMTDKAGIKKHGNISKEVFFTEFLQLHNMDVFTNIEKKNLMKEQIRRTLRALSVRKEKRDDALKCRTCAVGTPEQHKKNQTASPTAHAD